MRAKFSLQTLRGWPWPFHAVIFGLALSVGGTPYTAARTLDNLAQEAANLVNAGQYEKAVLKFKKAIKQDPKNASLHLSLGLTYQSLKQYLKAIRSIEKAAKLAPLSAEAHYSLALLYEAIALQPKSLMKSAANGEGFEGQIYVLGVGSKKSRGKKKLVQRRYLLKAKSAWKEVLRLEKDERKLEVARKHLKEFMDQEKGK